MGLVIQTPQGPIPTIPTVTGKSSGLGTPSSPFLIGGNGRGVELMSGRLMSFSKLYRSQVIVGTMAGRLAGQAARLPVHAFKYIDGESGARDRDRTHPAYSVLRSPTPGVPGFRLRWQISLGLKIQGNHVLYKRRPRRGAPPNQLWWLDWRMLEAIMDGDTGRVAGWKFHGTGIPGVTPGRFIDRSDVIHFAFDSPEGEIGVSPLEQLGITIRNEDAIQRYSEAAFKNGTRVGMGIVLEKNVANDETTRSALKEALQAGHGGVDEAFKSVVLGGGVADLKPLGNQTAVEAELIDQRKVNREDAAGLYGIPQPLAGILDHATYSNIEQLLGSLFTVFLAPEIMLTAETLQTQLIESEPAWRDDGIFLEHNLAEVLRADTLTRYRAYAIAVAGGWLTLNDVRRYENQKPFDDPNADKPLVQGNNVVPLSDIAADAIKDPKAAAHIFRGVLEASGLNGESELLAEQLAAALEGAPA